VNALERIVEMTREEVARRKADGGVPGGRDPFPRGEARSFAGALAQPGLSVIAEHKRRSPSAGTIRAGLALEDVVSAYERGGARALSILTEGPSFGGSLDDLRAAREASSLPLLRKDFIVDRFQVEEAAAAGADAILLIVAVLGDDDLRRLHEDATELGLDALVEVHDARELGRAVAIGTRLIGINNRDLTTLQVDTSTTFELRERVPADALVIAESGFNRREQLDALRDADVDAVLIGEGLMRAPDIELACRALTGL
jgi:indole-3-glycerol phosphate synthase